MKLVSIGFGNLVNSDAPVFVASLDSVPIKRIIQSSKNLEKLTNVAQEQKNNIGSFYRNENIMSSCLKLRKIAEILNAEAVSGGSEDE